MVWFAADFYILSMNITALTAELSARLGLAMAATKSSPLPAPHGGYTKPECSNLVIIPDTVHSADEPGTAADMIETIANFVD